MVQGVEAIVYRRYDKAVCDICTNGIILEKWNYAGRRIVGLTVTYRFRQVKNKYKGEASTDELRRL